jgi:hypothetical protein
MANRHSVRAGCRVARPHGGCELGTFVREADLEPLEPGGATNPGGRSGLNEQRPILAFPLPAEGRTARVATEALPPASANRRAALLTDTQGCRMFGFWRAIADVTCRKYHIPPRTFCRAADPGYCLWGT